MAQTTTNYGLYKPEATDTYNHLVYDNPNMDTIDAAMKDNSDHAVDNASCIKSGTVHSVTRTNTSCPVFKFTATGDWNTGDTMNVDGTPVSVFLPNGTAPLTGCFVINTEVLAIISGSRVTLMCPVIPDASDVVFDPTGTLLSATDVEAAFQELDASVLPYDSSRTIKQMIDIITNSITSAHASLTVSSGNVTRSGKVVSVSGFFTASANITSGDTPVIINLPYTTATRIDFPIPCVNGNTVMGYVLANSSSLRLEAGTIVSGQIYPISFSYMTND